MTNREVDGVSVMELDRHIVLSEPQYPKHHHWLYRRENIDANPVCVGVAASKAATMVTMPTQKAIGSGPSIGAAQSGFMPSSI
jgi:hypothetical protein